MTHRASALALALLLAVPAAAGAALPAPGTCSPQPERGTPVALEAPKATLMLRVADQPETREFGLMCVLALAPHGGMIFVFDGADVRRSFWMKNTLIPLDMVWVKADGLVTTVAANVPATKIDTAYDKIPTRDGLGAYVIELAAGEAARDGLVAGVRLDVARFAPKH